MSPVDRYLATWLQAALDVRGFVDAAALVPGLCIRRKPASPSHASVDIQVVASAGPVGNAVACLDSVRIIERAELGGQFEAGVTPTGFRQHVHGSGDRAAAMENGARALADLDRAQVAEQR